MSAYVNLELKVPAEFHDDLRKYTSKFRDEEGTAKDIDRSPFDRYVDLWWAAIGVGVCEGRMTASDTLEKFVTGAVLSNDPWRVTHLELLAVGHTGDAGVVGRPGEVIDIANGYAATGLPILCELLMKNSAPIWEVSNHLKQLAAAGHPQIRSSEQVL